MGFNEINYDGGLMIITSIQNKPKLRILNLDGNCFGQEGCPQIIAQMQKCLNPNALQSLDEVVSEEEADASGGEDDADQQGDDNDTIEYADDDYGDNEEEDDGEYDPNDTTEEVDEDDDEYANDNSAEETAYVTTNTFPTKVCSLINYKFIFTSITSKSYQLRLYLFSYLMTQSAPIKAVIRLPLPTMVTQLPSTQAALQKSSA